MKEIIKKFEIVKRRLAFDIKNKLDDTIMDLRKETLTTTTATKEITQILSNEKRSTNNLIIGVRNLMSFCLEASLIFTARKHQFFAQSLTTPMPESLHIPNMPTFTVMTPHYEKKIVLSLKEIIREKDKNARMTLRTIFK